MKRSIKSLLLVILLVVFVGGYYGVQYLNQPVETVTQESGTFALTERTEEIIGMQWSVDDETCHFVLSNGVWVNADNEAFPVDQEAVSALADDLHALTATRRLDNITDPANYGLADPAYTVTVEWSNGITTDYMMGSETPFGDGYYLALSDNSSIAYTTTEALSGMFAVTANELAVWEDIPTVENVTRLVVGDALDASYEETSRTINPGQHWYAATGEALDGIDSLITTAQALSWASLVTVSATENELTEWSLDEDNATAITLYGDEEATAQLLLGNYALSGDMYARLPDSSMVYTVDYSDALTLLTATTETMRSMEILSLSWSELISAELSVSGNQIALTPVVADESDEDDEDEETSAEETLWLQITALSASERVTAEVSGEPLLTIHVTAASGMTETLTFMAYDADNYLLTTDRDAFLVSADEVDRLIRSAKQLKG